MSGKRRSHRMIVTAALFVGSVLAAGILSGCMKQVGPMGFLGLGQTGEMDMGAQGGASSGTAGSEDLAGTIKERALGEPVLFTSFRLMETNSSAIYVVYEAEKTGDGVRFSYSEAGRRWNEAGTEMVEEKDPICVIHGDSALYERLCRLLGDCYVDAWNGFYGPNPPDILDGGGFGFEAVLANGTTSHAEGTNNYPDGHGELLNGLREICDDSSYENVLLEGLPELVLTLDGRQYRSALAKVIPSKELSEELSKGPETVTLSIAREDEIAVGTVPFYIPNQNEDVLLSRGDLVITKGDELRIYLGEDRESCTRLAAFPELADALLTGDALETVEITLQVEYAE